VSDVNAINQGGLAGNIRFFGSNTAEITSAASGSGGWNADRAHSVYVTTSWFGFGARSDEGSVAGLFGPGRFNGVASVTQGHRTILSGY
jgi:hypothetical protein